MNMPKKIIFLAGLFVVLGLASLLLVLKGRPTADTASPFEKVPETSLSKIEITPPETEAVTFEQKEGVWKLTAPIQDDIDEDIFRLLLTVVKSFTVNSIISENKDRYDQFEIQEASATRLKIFVTGTEAPVVDGFIGKNALGVSSSFFRYADKEPVRTVNAPAWVFRRSYSEYRLKKALPVKTDTVTKIRLQTEKESFTLVRSSDTWTREENGKGVESTWIKDLQGKLDLLTVYEYGTGAETPAQLGFEKPFLVITVESPALMKKAIIGNKFLKPGEKEAKVRYAKTEGRSATLTLATNLVDDVLTSLKTLPK